VWIRRLSISQLRNLADVDVELGSGLNYLYGRNGAGKTALLEAVHLLGRGRSFRSGQVQDLIRREAGELLVRANLEDEHRGRLTVAMTRNRRNRGELRINGEAARRLSELAVLLPLQVLTPGLSDLVFGSPVERRQWLDWGLFHVEPEHLRAWRQYLHALKQRNAALKAVAAGELPESALLVWTDEVAGAGDLVNQRRQRYVNDLEPLLSQVLGDLAPELRVDMVYEPGWRAGDSLRKVLGETLSRELKSGTTQSGPHRADVSLRTEGVAAAAALSRGQGKAVASAMMLAQARLLMETARRASVFLIDDIGAEFDLAHSARFFRLVTALGCQVLATSNLGPEHWREGVGLDMRVFHVEQGRVDAV
jgi:DNA replication and repair protein RecF